MKDNVLVIGSGFLTDALVRRLVESNRRVIIVTDKKVGGAELWSHASVTYVTYAKLLELPRDSLKSITYIYYAAGPVDHGYHHPLNSSFFFKHYNFLVTLVSGFSFPFLRSFFYFSSSDVYQSTSSLQLLNEDSRQKITSSYALAKSTASNFLLLKAHECGLPVIIIRPFLIYGRGQNTNRIIGYLSSESVDIKLIERPGYVRDFLYVDDFIDAIFILSFDLACNKELVFNICSSVPVALSCLQEMMRKYLPDRSIQLSDVNDTNYKVGDLGLLSAVTKWSPKVDLDRGISMMFAR